MASTSTQSSTSSSYVPDFPQSQFLMDTAQYASSLAPQMLQWAQQQYAHNQQLTDSIIHEADLYSDPGHIAANMGSAEAGVAQATDAAMRNAQQDLQRYGIDPSSGRYADLDKASQVRAAASKAGAGQQSRLSDEATARALRSEGVNASLANENIGGNLMKLPNSYLQTAMSLKYPPLGNKSQSSGSSSSSDPSHDSGGSARQPGGGGGGQGSGGGSPGGGGSTTRQQTRSDPSNGGGGGGRGNAGNSSAQIKDVPGGGVPGWGDMNSTSPVPYTGQPNDEYGGQVGSQDYFSAYDPSSMGGPGDIWGTQDNTSATSGWGDQFGDDGGVQGQSGSWGGDWGQNPMDSGGGQQSYDTGGGDPNAQQSYDTGGGDQYAGDYSGGDSGSYDDFSAAGGGPVPRELSPSGGRNVDDVRARVAQTGEQAHINVDEFIIPRDVALWKGQEFFQKMIQQSRAALASAPAKGKQGPPQGQRPQPQPQQASMGQ